MRIISAHRLWSRCTCVARQNGVIIVVLQLDELFAELTDVVVVHQGHCSRVSC